MLANELRQKYLDFFAARGHLYLPCAPLTPIDVLGEEDKTTLFTGSGMQQFKPYFTGAATPPHGRIATVQKCVRTGDIESAGDLSHCTFFEMLGNFSFGDYFKAEVIPWTWEFLTKEVGLDPDRFCVTVYLDDDEAFEVWNKVVGLPEDRIHRMGEDKNYWPANAISEGPDGPCGPCSEVFYRVVPLEEMTTDPSLTPTERYKIDDDAGRWLEVWNNVFTQFDRSEDETGKAILTPLPKKNNDTGAGFDRIVQVHQGKQSVFQTDLFEPILDQIVELSGHPYTGTMEPVDFALRVIAEHSRTMVFCIGDGILPSNEGRGYVLRYIMRRAMRYGKTVLGFDEPFLYKIAPRVIDQMGGFYTELAQRRELILQTIKDEEERFLRTLANGMGRLTTVIEAALANHSDVLSGEEAFTLYDTYGFPLELTKDIASERGLTVDLSGFEQAKAEQQQRSRIASAPREVWATGESAIPALQKSAPPTDFLGYKEIIAEAKVVAIIHHNTLVDSARAGDEVEIVLDQTPFYAEAGGQVGDTGFITTPGGDTTCALKIHVLDTQKTSGYWLHKAKVLEGEVHTGQTVLAAVDGERRRDIMRNHTTTHLLQAALREVLGGHVHQKGSLVSPDILRFDFTHTQPMTHDELWRVEEIVNQRILADEEVHIYSDIPISEAKERGAMALFGEKYGDTVRMVEVPGFSLELCGGIHLQRTSQAALFKIQSETGVGAGIRRIEACTGRTAIEFVNNVEMKLEKVAQMLKSNPRDILIAAEKFVKERSDLQKQIQQLKSGAASTGGDLETIDVSGIPVILGAVPNADGEMLSNLADRTAQSKGSAVVVLGSESEGKVVFVAKVTADLVQRGFHAGNIVREVAKIAGGGGGGRPDFAQAGGRDASKLKEALSKVPELVEQQLSTTRN
jgi:alanyl-tRNA synthetase